MKEKLKATFSVSNRALLSELVRTDFKLRYQGSVLGYAWSLLRPLLMFAIIYTVFAYVFKVGRGVPNYPVYLLLGIVLWNFFTELTTQSLGSVVARGDLIRKIRIPRWLIILSTSFSALINLTLNLIVVFVIALLTGMDLLKTSVFLPLFIIEIYVFALGLSLFLSALYVKYRDMSYIWEVILQAGFYLTPILYPVTLVTNQFYQKLILVNPMAQAIQSSRDVFVTPETVTIGNAFSNSTALLIPIAIVVVVFVLGLLYFKKEARNFAENI